MFETLHREVERGVADGQGYANVLKHSLLRREGAGILPRDDEFRRCFEWRDFYHIDRKCLYLYDRLENGDSVERVNVVGMLEDGTLTVEHIMPQTLGPQWRCDLGEGVDDEVHAAYVNTIGNLTLTGYNSQYSNNPFADKRDGENGFRDSGLRLSRALDDGFEFTGLKCRRAPCVASGPPWARGWRPCAGCCPGSTPRTPARSGPR